MHFVRITTSWGEFAVAFSEQGLARVQFPADPPPNLPKTASRESRNSRWQEWQPATAAALRAVLAGRPPGALPPLDWSAATPFQQAVWAELRRIPLGQVRTYAEIASALGRPKATRAVGGACGANPIPLFVPCHRVTAAHGRLGGFSGGLDWKRRLLAVERGNARSGELE